MQRQTGRMVQIGIVLNKDEVKGIARVKFPDTGIISDWLIVVRHGSGDWFPCANDKVLVLYLSGMNSDGFILGVV